jgi:hypothetical protein
VGVLDFNFAGGASVGVLDFNFAGGQVWGSGINLGL